MIYINFIFTLASLVWSWALNVGAKRPNIVFILTDDQDKEMGSMNFMPRTLKIMREGGASFESAFTSTAMCCPSRSSILTGMYTHNHHVYTNNDNCSSSSWREKYEPISFGNYLQKAGYRTGYFGKYLNEYAGTHIPNGWDDWVGLVQNSRYYNYTINVNGRKIRHGDNYTKDYFTDLIANDTLEFMKNSKTFFPDKPWLIVASMPAPHGHEDAAPHYQDMFANISTHRTPSWNVAPNPDKQWLLQYTEQMTDTQKSFTDLLHRKRLQTLQSVDLAVQRIYDELSDLGELDNTYFLYTSDHGYHMGQFGLVKGKAMPYDFDTRIPFYFRGPQVPAGVMLKNIVLNIDIAPTLMDIAGVTIPDHVDGKSILKLFKNYKGKNNGIGTLRRQRMWRDSFLIERGKITQVKLISREKSDGRRGSLKRRKLRRKRKQLLRKICNDNEKYRSCNSPSQRYVCATNIVTGAPYVTICPSVEHDDGAEVSSAAASEGGGDGEGGGAGEGAGGGGVGQEAGGGGAAEGANRRANASPEFANDIVFGKCICDNDLVSRKKRENFPGDPISSSDLPTTDINSTEFQTINNTQISDNDNDDKHVLNKNQFVHLQTDSLLSSEASLANRCRVLQDNTVNCEIADKRHLMAERKLVKRLIEKYRAEINKLALIEIRLNALISPTIHNPVVCKCTMNVHLQDLKEVPTYKRRRNKHQSQRNNNKCIGRRCQRRIINKMRRRNDLKKNNCYKTGMECSLMTNDHWTTEPRWNLGNFCYCANSSNNTYWCMRKINDLENILYCEFITGYISFYDLKIDPYQLHNTIQSIGFNKRQEYSDSLNALRACSGSNCNIR